MQTARGAFCTGKMAGIEYYNGVKVAIIMGSESDMGHAKKIKEELDGWKIPSYFRIGSAHRAPLYVMGMVDELNKSLESMMIVSIAGGTDALSGLIAANSRWPVISCPPDDRHVQSCLGNPAGTSNATMLKPENAARFAAQYFSPIKNGLAEEIIRRIQKKREEVEGADRKYGGGGRK